MNLPALSTLKDSFRFSVCAFRFKRKTEGIFEGSTNQLTTKTQNSKLETNMSCNPPSFRFCPCCGGPLERRPLGGRDRLACRDCRRVLYVNPAVGVAVVVRRG